MATAEIPEPSEGNAINEWDMLVQAFGNDETFLRPDTFLKNMFIDAPRRMIGAATVGSMLIYETSSDSTDEDASYFGTTQVHSPVEMLSDTEFGPLFMVGDDENNLDILIFEGSLLTNEPEKLFTGEPPTFSIIEWPEKDENSYTETTLEGAPVLLSRAMVLGAHAVWRRALPREKYLYYRRKFDDLTAADFDKIPVSHRNGIRLHAPKYSLVSPAVLTKVEIYTEDDKAEVISL